VDDEKKILRLETIVDRVKTVFINPDDDCEEFSSEITSVHWLESETISKADKLGYKQVVVDDGRIVYDVKKCMKVLKRQKDPRWDQPFTVKNTVKKKRKKK